MESIYQYIKINLNRLRKRESKGDITAKKKLVSMALAFVIAHSLCRTVCAENFSNTGKVQKCGDIGQLSKLNLISDRGGMPCNRYEQVLYV